MPQRNYHLGGTRHWLLSFLEYPGWDDTIESVVGSPPPPGVRVLTGLIYDPGVAVYLCEMTSSYELFPVGNILLLETDEAKAWYDSLEESIREELADGIECEWVDYEPTYTHCHRLPDGISTGIRVTRQREGRWKGQTNWNEAQDFMTEAASSNSELWFLHEKWEKQRAKETVTCS